MPFLRIQNTELNSILLTQTKKNRIFELKRQAEEDNKNYDSFIQIKFTENEFELDMIIFEIKNELGKHLKMPNEVRINHKKWVLLNYPSIIDAYKAGMSTKKFTKFALNAMTCNYCKLKNDITPLKKLMEKTDKVRITGKNTDITFSIKNMPIIPCCGEKNIPDGEIYTAPIKQTVNGFITYNTKSLYNVNNFENISLTIKNGKIIDAKCKNNTKELNEIFNSDDGSRYIGEFAIGVNKKILDPIGDILYDEKINGSIHFTPGCCYDDANNGNKSIIHWDLVLIQRKEYGDGNIYFDNILIRENGKFVIEDLNI